MESSQPPSLDAWRVIPPDFSGIRPGGPAGHASGPAEGPSPGRQRRVLIVEDEPVLRRLAVRVLTRHGYDVLEAEGPGEAIALAEQHPGAVHLVLTDVMMPDMRGWDLVERLRPSQPAAKVLYMSGYVDESETGSHLVQPLLLKPFRPTELIARIRTLLDD